MDSLSYRLSKNKQTPKNPNQSNKKNPTKIPKQPNPEKTKLNLLVEEVIW